MPDFNTHLRTGFLVHALLVIGAGLAFLTLETTTALVIAYSGGALPLTLFGGLFPDVDSPRARPYQAIYRHVPRVIAALTGVVLTVNATFLTSLTAHLSVEAHPGFLAGAGATLLVIGVWYWTRILISELRPPHRTVTHCLPVGLALATIIGAGVVAMAVAIALPRPLVAGVVAAGAFGLGFVTHLQQDGHLLDCEMHLPTTR